MRAVRILTASTKDTCRRCIARSIAPPPPVLARGSYHLTPVVRISNSPQLVRTYQRRLAGSLMGRYVGSALQSSARSDNAVWLWVSRSCTNVVARNDRRMAHHDENQTAPLPTPHPATRL